MTSENEKMWHPVPVWQDATPSDEGVRGGVRTDAKSYDAIVVGAGIAGLTCAYLLARAGRRVAVLERTGIGAGESGRTTAQFATAIDDRYFELERIHGRSASRLAAESQIDAIALVEEIVAREGIECDARRVPGYLFAGPEHDALYLNREREAAERAHTGARAVPAVLPALSADPWLEFPNQLRLHPGKYLHGLARAIRRLGGEIRVGAHAVETKWIRGGSDRERLAAVRLADGALLRASSVVVATNTPVFDRVTMHTKQAAYRTYVIAAEVPRGSVPDAFYWDTSDPYHYVRLEGLGEGPVERLIVGGEDHKTGQSDSPEKGWARLEKWTRERFPSLGPVTHRWSGQIMESVDGFPFAGRNPGDPEGSFIVTGDSGNGMTNGTIGAKIVADLVCRVENRYAALYAPDRKPFNAAGEFLRENLNVVGEYAKWLVPAKVKPASLGRGEGVVAFEHGRPIAVSRDGSGAIHACSGVCPHLGARLRWNAAERSWDCPAHGSRFTADGEVLNGPANCPLRPAKSETRKRVFRPARSTR